MRPVGVRWPGAGLRFWIGAESVGLDSFDFFCARRSEITCRMTPRTSPSSPETLRRRGDIDRSRGIANRVRALLGSSGARIAAARAVVSSIASRVLAFLAARWWSGVSVLIALIALAWAVWIGSQPPANPLERELAYLRELDPDDPRSYLVVETAETYMATRPIENYREVVLEEDAVLQVRETSWSLSALSIQFGTNVRIEARGEPGQDGASGNDGSLGPRCGHGTSGGPGAP